MFFLMGITSSISCSVLPGRAIVLFISCANGIAPAKEELAQQVREMQHSAPLQTDETYDANKKRLMFSLVPVIRRRLTLFMARRLLLGMFD